MRFILMAVGLVCVSLLGCGGKDSGGSSGNGSAGSEELTSTSAIRFEDRTGASDVNTVYDNGKSAQKLTMLETLGGGAAIFDFDRDGVQDILLAAGGSFHDVAGGETFEIKGLACDLWHGAGDAKYRPANFQDSDPEPLIYSHAVEIADFDADGFCDVLIAGFGGVRLYQNMGDGTFQPIENSGLQDKGWTSCASWGDWDQDGILDLYVVNYLEWNAEIHRSCPAARELGLNDVCAPRHFDDFTDRIYFGLGDGRFEERSKASGLVQGGKGLGVISTDIDRDGDLDIYVANDTTPNFLYLNDGNGNFVESGLAGGVALDGNAMPNGSMGVAIGDYNRDGMFDLGVANFDHESYAVYRQDLPGMFFYVSDATGLTAIGKNRVSWGTAFVDFDSDGDEDLIINNGHILYHPASGQVEQPCVVMENRNGKFVELEMPSDHYLSLPHNGRGLAVGDLDGDRDPDLVLGNINESVALLSNESKPKGEAYVLELLGIDSPRNGLGAVVEIETTNSRQLRTLTGAGSFLSSNQPAIFFAVPKGESLSSVTIHWPSGKVSSVSLPEPGVWLAAEDDQLYRRSAE